MSILYKQILIFSTQTPKGLLCPINGTHRASFCNKNDMFSLLCLFPLWPRLQGLLCANVQGQDHFLSLPSTPCSMPLFPRLPGSQAPRPLHASHIHCPKAPVRPCPGLASPAVANSHAFVHSFILTTSKHLLSPCDWQVY